jgi:signal transduction histidine kinase
MWLKIYAVWLKRHIANPAVESKLMRILPVFSIRDRLLITIGTLTLLISLLAGHEVVDRWQQLGRIGSLKEATLLGDDLFNAGEKLSIERHLSYSILYMSDPTTLADLGERLKAVRHDTDIALANTLPPSQGYKFSDLQSDIQSIESSISDMDKLRKQIDRNIQLPLRQRDAALPELWFVTTTGLVKKMQVTWREVIKDFIDVDPIVNAQMRFKYFLWSATEYTGEERALIGRFIVENSVATPEEQSRLLRWQGIVDNFWSTVDIVASASQLEEPLKPYLKDAKSDYDNVYDMLQGNFLLPGPQRTKPYPISSDLWLELSTQSNQSLYDLKDVALAYTHSYVDKLEERVKREIVVRFIILLLTLLLSLYSFWVVLVRVLHPINTMIEALVSTVQGKVVSPKLLEFRQDDEIGKLAHVLSVSQKNNEELKNYSAKLQQYVEELKHSNQELDDFAYIASHDLKEPLRGLITQATFLLDDYQDKLDAEAIRRLRRLVYLSQRMEQLTGELLYFSRLGRSEFAIQKVDPNEVVAEIRQMMDVFLSEHHAKVIIHKQLPTIVCDKVKVTEVFRNLITNAVKYNDKPEKVVEIGFLDKIESPHGLEKDVFFIKDNGVGIEKEFSDAIFRIFKRLKNPAVKDEEGTGAGLTFVKKIIERHKGHIWIESVPGTGSVFYFTLHEQRG